MSKAPARRRLSGFCNPTLPRTDAYDPHQRCGGCDCRAPRCPCNPEETLMPTTEKGDRDSCPDGGTCHHRETCGPDHKPCFRVLTCGPLSGVFPEDRWPATVAAEHGARLAMPTDPDPPLAPQDAAPAGASSPEDAVAWLRSAADALNTALAGYGPEDWRDALRLLRDLRRAVEVIRKVDASVVQWLYLHGEHGQHQVVDGIPGPVYIGRGRSKERWATESAVLSYVEQKIAANDGEMPDYDTVLGWVAEVVPLTSSTSVRKTALRAVGLDVADYYTSEPGTVRVDFPT